MDFVLRSPGSQVQGFLAAGHAASVTGVEELHALSTRHRVPVVVTGFEPVDLLDGILRCVRQLEAARGELELTECKPGWICFAVRLRGKAGS